MAGQNAGRFSAAFHWCTSRQDAALFERVKTAFAEELKPDDPERVKPVVAQKYKWISRVGVFRESALVVIGEREARTSSYGDYFVAYNLDLKSGEKSPITVSAERSGFMQWKFKKLVHFDSSEAPDVAFAYSSCVECEADYLLSSFRLDTADGKWKVRAWDGDRTEILIGSDYTAGTDENTKDDCLFKFGDFNGDGFDDLIVRCASMNDAEKILEDTTTLFTIQQGRPQIITIQDRKQLVAIHDRLCSGSEKSRLCR